MVKLGSREYLSGKQEGGVDKILRCFNFRIVVRVPRMFTFCPEFGSVTSRLSPDHQASKHGNAYVCSAQPLKTGPLALKMPAVIGPAGRSVLARLKTECFLRVSLYVFSFSVIKQLLYNLGLSRFNDLPLLLSAFPSGAISISNLPQHDRQLNFATNGGSVAGVSFRL